MRLFYDLHTHSCLSPCGDMEMTPNNLVNMAYLKGIEMLAVSDHNHAGNLRAIAAICEARDILHIPAIEAETREEVHVVCYLPTVSAAEELADVLYKSLPDMPYDANFFGEQVIMNDDDEEIKRLDKLLIQATTYSIEELFGLCREIGGEPVPAHINKDANSILAILGFIPPDLGAKTVEFNKNAGAPMFFDPNSAAVLRSSDAHMLEALSERENSIELEEKSVACFLDTIRRGGF